MTRPGCGPSEALWIEVEGVHSGLTRRRRRAPPSSLVGGGGIVAMHTCARARDWYRKHVRHAPHFDPGTLERAQPHAAPRSESSGPADSASPAPLPDDRGLRARSAD